MQSTPHSYFILWLREYTIRYNNWAEQMRCEWVAAVEEGVPWSTTHTLSRLAMFYSRAKETFLTHGARYELRLPSHYLAPFRVPASHSDPHPDPESFSQVAIEARNKLERSLQRFVSAQLKNVGNKRLICGMTSGFLLFLIGAVPMIVATIIEGDSKWLRLALFPAIWFSTTVMISALHGVCIGVYAFGDFRQLRKYELARPVAPSPEPRPLPSDEPSIAVQNVTTSPMPLVTPPDPAHCSPSHSLSRPPSTTSVSTSASSIDFREPPVIIIDISSEISDEPDGALCTVFSSSDHEAEGYAESIINNRGGSMLYNATASFIHPYVATENPDPLGQNVPPENHRRIDRFDFNALPPKLRDPHTENVKFIPEVVIARLRALNLESMSCSQDKMTHSPSSSFGTSFPDLSSSPCRSDDPEKIVRSRFRKVMSVPAFAVPWTPVLSPVIRRGQWEIVTRSLCCAFLISLIITGSLVAIPVHR
jgi:hypothetical protein